MISCQNTNGGGVLEPFNVGDKVVMNSKRAHEKHPLYYPAVGTVGVIMSSFHYHQGEGSVYVVQWPHGSTSDRDLWSATHEQLAKYNDIEPTTESIEELDEFFSEY